MTEEEKKAVELLKNIKNSSWTTKYIMSSDSKNAEILLNLIEKLQKENKKLKEYIAIAPNLDEMTAMKYINIQRDAYIQGRAEESKTNNF